MLGNMVSTVGAAGGGGFADEQFEKVAKNIVKHIQNETPHKPVLAKEREARSCNSVSQNEAQVKYNMKTNTEQKQK